MAYRFLTDYTPATIIQKNGMENIRKQFKEMAEWLNGYTPDCAEKSAGMRHLLEAKDAFVRSVMMD